MTLRALALVGLLCALAVPAAAGSYSRVDWADLKPQIFGDELIEAAGAAVVIEAPVRAEDDARVEVTVAAELLDGARIRSVTLIIDENPMPVSAVFTPATPQMAVTFGATFRFDGPSPLRAVIETTDGRLLMAERLVKTSGRGACSAPPVGDPAESIARIGEMRAVAEAVPAGVSAPRRVELAMAHPQHSGLQMDQITLHYILARYIEAVEVSAGDRPLFALEGSISLAEDPAIWFELADPQAQAIRVRMQDTDGALVERELLLGAHG